MWLNYVRLRSPHFGNSLFNASIRTASITAGSRHVVHVPTRCPERTVAEVCGDQDRRSTQQNLCAPQFKGLTPHRLHLLSTRPREALPDFPLMEEINESGDRCS